MTGTVQLSVGIATFGTPTTGDWRGLLDTARAADGAGVDRIVVSDHVVLGPHTADYPWGRFPTAADGDWLEPLATIAALAAVTERVRFLTGVLVAPLRPAALLAKSAATIDVLSGGRLDLGVGTGWQREEFDAVGLDFERRGELLTRAIEGCRSLWTGEPVTIGGPATLGEADADGPGTEVWCNPKPVQDPLPVWFSGTLTRRNVDRIVRLGDGWIPIMGASVVDLADGVATLHAALAEAGRDPAPLAVRAALPVARDADGRADVAATFAAVGALVAAGATDVHVPLRAFDPDGTDPAGTLRALVGAFEAAR